MRDYVTEFPCLNNLIGGYFHQDWRSHGETADEVVIFYCQMERHENRRGAVADIDRLLSQTETEDQLADALQQLGCAYRVRGVEESIRSWLRHIRSLVKSSFGDEH